MTYNSSQEFETYIPVYDAIPTKWEEAQPFLVERLKEIANATNLRAVGWMLDEELLSGFQFIPITPISGTSEQYRTVLRKVVDTGALIAGVNAGINHGIVFDSRFTLIDLWVSGTNSGTLTARNISADNVLMNATQLVITSPQAFDRSFAQILYIQEI